jgi:hypothetical protein
MMQLRRAPGFRISHGQIPLYSQNRIQWSCPAFGVYSTVEAIDDVDEASEAIRAHHDLVSPKCLNSRPMLDMIA